MDSSPTDSPRQGRRDYGPDFSVEDRGYSTPCWVWQKWISKRGYGKITRDGKTHLAHRWYYTEYRGPIPDGFQLDHLCRIKRCVNPAHLAPRTAEEHAKQHPIRGFRRGSHPHLSLRKLTDEQVRTIRQRRGTIVALAVRYGVSTATICNVRYGRLYRDVDD